MKIDITLVSSIVIFVVTSLKSIFDLIINPYIHSKLVKIEKEKNEPNYLKIGKQKRYRGDISTTLVFVVVSVATFFIIKEMMMNENVTKKEYLELVSRVEKLENYVFGGHGGTTLSVRIEKMENRISKIEKQLKKLTSEVNTISIEYARKKEKKALLWINPNTTPNIVRTKPTFEIFWLVLNAELRYFANNE